MLTLLFINLTFYKLNKKRRKDNSKNSKKDKLDTETNILQHARHADNQKSFH